jgi:hypothetical protein
MIDDSSTLPAAIDTVAAGCRPSISLPRSPKKKSGCKKQKSARTRRAYRLDVHHSMRSLAITTPAEPPVNSVISRSAVPPPCSITRRSYPGEVGPGAVHPSPPRGDRGFESICLLQGVHCET